MKKGYKKFGYFSINAVLKMNYFTCSQTLWLCIQLLQSYHLYDCYTINDTYTLLNDKLTNYNRKVRPTVNQSNPTEVSFGFQLISIQDFDQLHEKLSMIAVLRLNWYDEIIKWNSYTYGGIYSILTESQSLWTPNFVLANTAAKLDKIGDDWQSIRVFSNGTAYYFPLGIYVSACSADITLYPWDINICNLHFTPQGHLSTEITIKLPDNKVILDDFKENGAWKLLDTRVQLQYVKDYMAVDISLIIERRPRYTVVNILLPLIFMAFLGNVVFLIPTECGERISYSITMLLAIAVFLTLVGDNLPKNSTPMPYFSYFLISLLATGICVCCATIFSLRIYHKDDTKKAKGKWAKLVTYLDCSCRRKIEGSKTALNDMKLSKSDEALYRFMTNAQNSNHEDIRIQTSSQTEKLAKQNQVHPLNIEDETKRTSTEKKCHETEVEWKDVSIALDKIFFVIFNVTISMTTFIFFLLILTGERVTINDK